MWPVPSERKAMSPEQLMQLARQGCPLLPSDRTKLNGAQLLELHVLRQQISPSDRTRLSTSQLLELARRGENLLPSERKRSTPEQLMELSRYRDREKLPAIGTPALSVKPATPCPSTSTGTPIRHTIHSFIVGDEAGNWFRFDPYDPAQVVRCWMASGARDFHYLCLLPDKSWIVACRFGDTELPAKLRRERPNAYQGTFKRVTEADAALWLLERRQEIPPELARTAESRNLVSVLVQREHARPNDQATQKEVAMKRRVSVALSFPGEHRGFVAQVADALAAVITKARVFYDHYYEAELSRPNLDTYLQRIYHDDSDLVVVVLCKEYDEKEWCGLEFRAIRDLIKKRRDDEIMFVRVADGDVKGVFGIDGYVDAKNRSATDVAQVIRDRLALLQSSNP